MDDGHHASDFLCSPSVARNKRPLEHCDVESRAIGEKLCVSSAKRLHYHSDSLDGRKVLNGGFDDRSRPTSAGSNNVKTGVSMTNKIMRGIDLSPVMCLSAEVPKDFPVILNLSKNDDTGSYSDRCFKSPVSDDYKENADEINNLPIDLSKSCKAQSFEPITNGLEDETKVGFNGNGCAHLVGENILERLKEELRNEETKLVLLKKIRQSQIFHRLVKDGVDNGRIIRASTQAVPGPPPPLVRGAQPVVTSAQPTSTRTSEPSRLLPAHVDHQPPQSHGPPPLSVPSQVLAPTVPASAAKTTSTVSQTGTTSISQSQKLQTAPAHSQHTPTPLPTQPEQTPAQRQAAAKVALRKQLEKTLLQIPPPKPPPPEMNFIPNVGNGDFVTLLGLEEAVKCILDNDARARGEPVAEVKYVFNPFQCVQCHTDFTPVWKRDKPGSKNVICERCVTNNQKWALKQEHTNRLKSAFVKALQQEQEIEQSLLAQNAMSIAAPHLASTSSYSPSSMLPKNLPNTQRSAMETPPQQQQRHHHHPNQQQQQLQHHQPSPRQSTLWTPPTLSSVVGLSQAFDPRLMFPFHRPPVTSKSPVDIQRQYLLDLIPRRSHLEGPVLWRT